MKMYAMTPNDLDWNRWQWPDVVRGAEFYHTFFSQQSREDLAYFRCRRALRDRSMLLALAGVGSSLSS